MALTKVPSNHQHHPSLVIKHYLDLMTDNPTLQRHCLKAANIPKNAIVDPFAKVSPTEEFAFLHHLLSNTKSNTLGFEAGKNFHVNCHEHLGFAALSSNTPLDALKSLVNFSDLTYSFFSLKLIIENTSVRLIFEDQYDLGELRSFYLLRDIAFTITAGRELIPQRQNLALCHSITLTLESGLFSAVEKQRMEGFFKCPLYFDGDENHIQYSREALDNLLPQANSLMHKLFNKRCEDELSKHPKQSTFSQQVRLCIQQSTGKIPTLGGICRQLNTSTRTAHRKLQDEKTGFKELLSDELSKIAIHQLKTGTPIKLIASDMGYSDTSSFISAFKRWTGSPPGEYLRQKQC